MKKNQVKIAELQQRTLVETYRQTVLTAFQEVEDALAAEEYASSKAQLQNETVTRTCRALELSKV